MKEIIRKNLKVLFVIAIFLTIPYVLKAAILGGGREMQFVQYLHEGEKGVVEISLDKVVVGIGYLTRYREIDKPNSEKPYEGSLNFSKPKGPVQIVVLEMAFIGKNRETKEHVYYPIDVYDSEIRHARKPKISFPEQHRKLPVIWTEKSTRHIYMKYPPIPESIKEGEISVKLKIITPKGEESFEKRFSVKQRSFISKPPIIT